MRDVIGEGQFVSKSLPRVFFGIPQKILKKKQGACVIYKIWQVRHEGEAAEDRRAEHATFM
jgi:hypothetical protein